MNQFLDGGASGARARKTTVQTSTRQHDAPPYCSVQQAAANSNSCTLIDTGVHTASMITASGEGAGAVGWLRTRRTKDGLPARRAGGCSWSVQAAHEPGVDARCMKLMSARTHDVDVSSCRRGRSALAASVSWARRCMQHGCPAHVHVTWVHHPWLGHVGVGIGCDNVREGFTARELASNKAGAGQLGCID